LAEYVDGDAGSDDLNGSYYSVVVVYTYRQARVAAADVETR